MSHGTPTFLRSPVRVIAVCALSVVVGAGAYVASAAASDGAASSGTGPVARHGFSVVRGGAHINATVLSGPPVSDGELMIHAAYEAARRMVEMQTTGTTTAPASSTNANP